MGSFGKMLETRPHRCSELGSPDLYTDCREPGPESKSERRRLALRSIVKQWGRRLIGGEDSFPSFFQPELRVCDATAAAAA